MKKIIVPGRTATFRVTCWGCGCIFDCEKEDVERDDSKSPSVYFISCPQCKTKSRVKLY